MVDMMVDVSCDGGWCDIYMFIIADNRGSFGHTHDNKLSGIRVIFVII